MSPHGDLDHDCETGGVGDVVYSGIWLPGGGRRKIYDDSLRHFHVAVPGDADHRPCAGVRYGTDGGVDRHVH